MNINGNGVQIRYKPEDEAVVIAGTIAVVAVCPIQIKVAAEYASISSASDRDGVAYKTAFRHLESKERNNRTIAVAVAVERPRAPAMDRTRVAQRPSTKGSAHATCHQVDHLLTSLLVEHA